MSTQQLGNDAEDRALSYLVSQGLDLLSRNFSCRRGEIDLVMQDDNCVVFVEVRMRNHPDYGSGADTVTVGKMRKLAVTAEHFLQQHPIPGNLDCRFDVISIDDKLDWIQNAFKISSNVKGFSYYILLVFVLSWKDSLSISIVLLQRKNSDYMRTEFVHRSPFLTVIHYYTLQYRLNIQNNSILVCVNLSAIQKIMCYEDNTKCSLFSMLGNDISANERKILIQC